MKKSFLFKGVSVLGAMLLLTTSVMPGLQYAYATNSEYSEVVARDYIYNAESWENSYENGALKLYYEAYPSEDLWSTTTNSTEPGFNDKIYTVELYQNTTCDGDEFEVKKYKAQWYSDNGVQKIIDTTDSTIEYYIPTFFFDPAPSYELFCGASGGYVAAPSDLVYPADKCIKVTSISYGENVSQSRSGAVGAPGAKYPRVAVKLNTPFTGAIKLSYDGRDDTYPWGESVRTFRDFAIASIPAGFKDNTFLLPENAGSQNGARSGTVGESSSFDPDKLTVTLVKPHYAISFDANGGEPTTIENQIKLPGENVEEPEVTRAGYIFQGWFNADDEFDFNTALEDIDVIEKSIALIAQWEAITSAGGAQIEQDNGTGTGMVLEAAAAITPSTEASAVQSDNSTATIQGEVVLNVYNDADLNGVGDAAALTDKVNFTQAVPVRIGVTSGTTARVKVKHNTSTGFDTSGLTTQAGNCSGGIADANQYGGGDIPVTSGYVEIWTCSASTFVAYTETQNQSSSSSSSSSGGGGGGSSHKTETKAETGSVATGDTAEADTTDTTGAEEGTSEETPVLSTAEEEAAVAKFGQEQIDAYKWALKNGITTMKTVDAARLDQPLTRAELAKMMVVYIQKVLEKDPAITGDVTYADVDESLGDLAGYIKLAYQYQIMGINANGTPIEAFNPNGLVTRGEYATVFSRVLFGDKFNKEGADFYTNHLSALEKAKILTNTTPTIQEIRGWVMLMMYRSSQNADDIQAVVAETEESTEETVSIANPAAEYCVAQGGESIIKTDKDGSQYGVCKLAEGTEVDEWEYFRANNTEETTSESTEETAE